MLNTFQTVGGSNGGSGGTESKSEPGCRGTTATCDEFAMCRLYVVQPAGKSDLIVVAICIASAKIIESQNMESFARQAISQHAQEAMTTNRLLPERAAQQHAVAAVVFARRRLIRTIQLVQWGAKPDWDQRVPRKQSLPTDSRSTCNTRTNRSICPAEQETMISVERMVFMKWNFALFFRIVPLVDQFVSA